MKIAEARKRLAEVGMVIRRLSDTQEWKVNVRGGTEATAYYAVDLDDAVETGLIMAKHREG